MGGATGPSPASGSAARKSSVHSANRLMEVRTTNTESIAVTGRLGVNDLKGNDGGLFDPAATAGPLLQ